MVQTSASITDLNRAAMRVYGATILDLSLRFARELLLQAGASGPPYSAVKIANFLGIRVEHESSLNARGMLTSHDGGPLIVVRVPARYEGGGVPLKWVNFTVAHEVGHFLLRRDFDQLGIGTLPSASAQEETFCESFAAHLLLPSFCIESDLKKHKLEPTFLLELCERYAVSLPVLLIRVQRFLPKDVVPILWERLGDRWKPKLRPQSHLAGAILCETGSTPIERAADGSGTTFSGSMDVLVDGERRRWSCIAVKLTDNSVLGILGRQAEWKTQWSALSKASRPPTVRIPRQLSLSRALRG